MVLPKSNLANSQNRYVTYPITQVPFPCLKGADVGLRLLSVRQQKGQISSLLRGTFRGTTLGVPPTPGPAPVGA